MESNEKAQGHKSANILEKSREALTFGTFEESEKQLLHEHIENYSSSQAPSENLVTKGKVIKTSSDLVRYNFGF